MKEKLRKALYVALTTSIGITIVSFIYGEEFSITRSIVYAVVAFIVDILFALLFDKNKK